MDGISREGEGRLGSLLLHGLTGTPDEVGPLVERLAARGHAIEAPLLPGHGTTVEDLVGVRWEDWFGTAIAAWERLASRSGEARYAAGVSMGGLLALHLAHERPHEIAAVALLAPALVLRAQSRAEGALWLSRFPWLPSGLEIVPKGPRDRQTPAYDRIATRAVGELVKLQRVVRAELGEIRTPALVLEGGRDLTVAPEAAAELEKGLGSEVKERKLFPEGRHVLTEGGVGEEVVADVERFFAAHPAGARGLATPPGAA